MSLILKDPAAALDYEIDWGGDYLDGDRLVGSEWSVAPAVAGGVVIIDATSDDRRSRVVVTGGREGQVYRLTNEVTTMEGRTDSRSIVLRVEAR